LFDFSTIASVYNRTYETNVTQGVTSDIVENVVKTYWGIAKEYGDIVVINPNVNNFVLYRFDNKSNQAMIKIANILVMPLYKIMGIFKCIAFLVVNGRIDLKFLKPLQAGAIDDSTVETNFLDNIMTSTTQGLKKTLFLGVLAVGGYVLWKGNKNGS